MDITLPGISFRGWSTECLSAASSPPGIITTKYMESNLLNGGAFGIEGGILTTIMTLLSFLFVWYYYRNSNYDFLSDKEKQETLR